MDRNAERWRAALAMEAANDPAICDTDPLKLHHVWSLWQIGEAPEERWTAQRAATRQAIVDRRLDFADIYIIGAVDPEVARRQRDGDATRRRGNFELHVRLQPSLLSWYGALAAILPYEVLFQFPSGVPAARMAHPQARYDVTLFDRAMACLPRP